MAELHTRANDPPHEAGESDRREYDSVRGLIETGDIFLYRGSSFWKPIVGWISPATKWFTESPYTHAGMAIWVGGRLMVIESIGRGVIMNPCSMSFDRHRSDVEWFRHRDPLSDEQRTKLLDLGLEALGKRFAFWKAFVALLKVKLGLPMERIDKYESEDRYYCSHFVASVYSGIGLDLMKQRGDPDMTPKDLFESPHLKRMHRVHRSSDSRRAKGRATRRPSGIRKKKEEKDAA